MTIPPFALLLLAIPILLLGEQLVRRVRWLGRLNIPAPIIGGLLAAVAVLVIQKVDADAFAVDGRTANRFWLWPILPRFAFGDVPRPDGVHQPLLILFFTCIGLNASWAVARQGGLPLVGYLALGTAFAAIQYAAGVGTALLVRADPLLGIMCSGVSLMGGFGTAASWGQTFEQNGLPNAPTIGLAAAAFGVVAGGLLAGPLAGQLVDRCVDRRASTAEVMQPDSVDAVQPPDVADALTDDGGFLDDVRNMLRASGKTLVHLAVLLACLKLGAYLSAWLGGVQVGSQKLTFPVYMGSMIVAAAIRNVHDVFSVRVIDTRHVDLIASFALAWMLTVVMVGLNLGALANLAGPMLAVLVVQVALMAAFAYWVVFRLMGRDYEAAAMSAGMVGFGLGATSNAVATMRQLARRFGPAPRAFLIVTVVGAFLIDFTNAFLIMGFLNVFKHAAAGP